ncbi:alpha/beta hydrolase [filamentous cyanobacterium LEGE 11480]|uniref:Alpha/beta hydrolase n=1 Tax=Romeriopsis navalis LEGE 11480 TaxID=2777977 RepID=A0A928Z654_9CYAN|nr:alpha/beta hydrolase [Romeriopsis navalis]MBE9032253.1 alpha/beta hydrolase [Romeriopsis navalis LEGE 11480]
MSREFIPHNAVQLTEATSVAMMQSLKRSGILTPLSSQPIETAFVPMAPASANASDVTVVQQRPIVLLHGFDSSLLEFRRLLPLLGAQQPAWAIDLLGFGFTDRQADLDFTPANIKTHLYYTWKTLIQQPMVLVGASMGGAAAIDFALTYPEAVEQLVLLDGAGFAKGPAISGVLSRFPTIGRFATNFLSRTDVRRQVSRKAYYDDATFVTADAELCAMLHLAMPGWSEALISFTCSGGYNFLSDRIAQVQQSTLVIWGRQDKILGTKDAARFERVLPQGQLIWIEDCGHVPHLEKAAATAAAIQEFVG